MKSGVIAVQGDVSEHIDALERAMKNLKISGSTVLVRRKEDLEQVDVLVIPGGESTTISKLMQRAGLFDLIQKRAEEGMPVMGTCAGCILLAKQGDEQVEKTKTKLLSLMDMKVDRNYFGRQRESFEAELTIEGLDHPFMGVFIRAPAIIETWGNCRPLSKIDSKIAMARQGNLLALTFHPELSGSTEIHEMLLSL
jgi:5'-phosphate synthase pdxT subunit